LQACLPTGDGGRDTAVDAEKKSRNPSEVKPEQIEQQGEKLDWGNERRRWRCTEARPPDLHCQMREREEAERMPHAAMTELAGTERRSRWRLTVAREGRAIRVRVRFESSERERRGCGRLGRAGPI
jgi:hypothetical protein